MQKKDRPESVTNLTLKEKKNLLKETDVFFGFTDRELGELCSLIELKYYPNEYEIFAANSIGEEMYIILSGKVCLTIDLGSSEWMKTIVLTSNNFFGEMSLLDERPRSAGATMCDEGILISVDKSTFRSLIKRFPKFSINIMTTICERIRKINDLLLQLNSHIARA